MVYDRYYLVTDPSGKRRYEAVELQWCVNYVSAMYKRTKVLFAIKEVMKG